MFKCHLIQSKIKDFRRNVPEFSNGSFGFSQICVVNDYFINMVSLFDFFSMFSQEKIL